MSKLAILAETEEDRYDTSINVVCYECQVENGGQLSGKLSTVVEGVMKALTFSKREEVKAWEQEFVPCKHTLGFIQLDQSSVSRHGK
jgi:ubiquitin carboxyl-terminal hydrolase 5/13